MKTRTIVTALLVILAAGAIGYAIMKMAPKPDAVSAVTVPYENAEYGYALMYPASLTVREYSMGNAVFGVETGDRMDGVAEVRILTIAGTGGESFEEAAARELSNLCAADGPGASLSCTGIKQLEPFTTSEGTPGYALYLEGEERNLVTNTVTTYEKGPYFIIPMQSGATGSKILVVHLPLNQNASQADAATIRAIAESVTFTAPAPATDDIGSYIRTNISELSPIKEQLGGTFYVTSLEARDGVGVVSYEDGHNAYTADFTYTIGEDGALAITSFVVRDQKL